MGKICLQNIPIYKRVKKSWGRGGGLLIFKNRKKKFCLILNGRKQEIIIFLKSF